MPILAQNRFAMMAGRFVASSPDFFQKSAALRREADLTRQIAHKQFNEAFGEGKACTKAVPDELAPLTSSQFYETHPPSTKTVICCDRCVTRKN